jgi:Kef-type K+ transport system membrane component KefB
VPQGLATNLAYLALIFALIVIPRALQRFRLPAPLTSVALGLAATTLLGATSHDAVLVLLSTLGISSLFLFAGLEVDVGSLWRGRWPLLAHLVLRSAVVAGATALAMRYGAYPWNTAALLALALLTPSTGFILESLPRLGLDEDECQWVRLKAIGGEILALLALFIILQADSLPHLGLSTAAVLAMIFGIPLLFRGLVHIIVPYAPGAEFSLLVMVGLIAAYLTDYLGVHFLVGAFIAGFVARMLRRRLPGLASDDNLHAIQLFASFFVPFYFFYAGMAVPLAALSLTALKLGCLLSVVVIPTRIAVIWLQRRFLKGESAMGSLRVATALTPTLIFTMVLATILHERFHLSDALFGALLIYAAVSTLLPSILLAKTADFAVTLPDAHAPAGAKAAASAVGN